MLNRVRISKLAKDLNVSMAKEEVKEKPKNF